MLLIKETTRKVMNPSHGLEFTNVIKIQYDLEEDSLDKFIIRRVALCHGLSAPTGRIDRGKHLVMKASQDRVE